jgi:hypothetical protein
VRKGLQRSGVDRFLCWLGNVHEALGFSWDEWRRPKPKEVDLREIQEVIRQQRFERFVTGKSKAE